MKIGNYFTDTATTQKLLMMVVMAHNPVVIVPSLNPPKRLERVKENWVMRSA